ncbi:MAG TPA: [protein-PII] uridylyltransferase, partial [Paracoccaceae bacterium]|nr:[protein-PII] uridylyltransferase [Paracoccaceae bacterium]
HRLWAELFLGTGPEFVLAKLAERDMRHQRHGGSRYLLEPNVKESKGGLRDLQTLHWISRYLFRTETAWELVDMGVFRRDEVRLFASAAKFIWAVRCHLHDLAGRPQEKLTFDRQVEIAARMGYQPHDGRMAVEHFMQDYFLHAKAVGDLTRIFSAALEAQHAKPAPALSLPVRAMSLRGSPSDVSDMVTIEGGWLVISDLAVILDDPVNMMRVFQRAARMDARIHPATMRLITQNLDLVDDGFRHDPEANALFLEILCDRRNSERMLRRMNETGFLGCFIPEFGRVVAMMQFNMYHHYTVDEHIIRAIGILAEIERGEARDAHPLSTSILQAESNRRVLYVALLLHDIGKGSPRDHSELGAELASRICPRLGLSEAEAEMVIWLVRHHLLMSDTAQKRDIHDPRTIADFGRLVQSPQRLRLLLVLTVCDIRAVGPGIWNSWKAQLLRDLYNDTRNLLTGDSDEQSRAGRVQAAQQALSEALSDWPAALLDAEIARHQPHYWLGFDTATHMLFAQLAREAGPDRMAIRFLQDPRRDTTMACFHIADHPGLFARMAGALALAGADVIDARSYTTMDGAATAVFWIQDHDARPFPGERLPRLRHATERALKTETSPSRELVARDRPPRREQSFLVPTRILFDNAASDLHTLIEVNARDRPGLLHDLAGALAGLNINIVTAIIATYGAHAVDVFYVKDRYGLKIHSKSRFDQIEQRLTEAVESTSAASLHLADRPAAPAPGDPDHG